MGQPLSARQLGNRAGSPFWMPDGRVGCLTTRNGRQRLTLPCGETVVTGLEERDVYGPVASSPEGETLYVSLLDARGFVGLWAWSVRNGNGHELAVGQRDTYAPSVSRDGTLLYKDQDYGTEVLVMPTAGGAAIPRTTFQAETPSWDPTGTRLGITYGTWRRVSDDFNYPDIAQDVGIIRADGAAPATEVELAVQRSGSEDQGMTWSPNGRWIAFHSHQQNSDDVWLRPADRDSPLTRISGLGRGAEVGWPRWSPDGKWIVFDGDAGTGAERRSQLWIVGVDQETGKVTVPAHPVPAPGLAEAVVHAEWLGSSDTIVFSTAAPPMSHTFYRVAREGGTPRVMHRYQSPQRIDGFGVGPGGAWLVYPAPDRNVRLQLFRVSTRGGDPEPLTSDSTDKTQPAVSPDGSRIAYTSWRYRARFWLLKP
jgi:Tol biopolymer transport system component